MRLFGVNYDIFPSNCQLFVKKKQELNLVDSSLLKRCLVDGEPWNGSVCSVVVVVVVFIIVGGGGRSG